MSTYPVRHEQGETKGRFVIDLGDKAVAELTYTKAGENRWIADHTGVPRAFEGQGIASQLVQAMVKAAITEDARILPLCSYVVAWAKRHPEYTNVFSA